MYQQYNNAINHMSATSGNFSGHQGNAFLAGSTPFYQHTSQHPIAKVAPAPSTAGGALPPSYNNPKEAFDETSGELNSKMYDALKPVLRVLKFIGILPVTNEGQIFNATVQWMVYSAGIFLLVVGYLGYLKWDKVEVVSTAEGRFEEAVIDYLFTVYLLPIVINPLTIYEARKQAKVLTDMVAFERVYNRTAKKELPIYVGNKKTVLVTVLMILSCSVMIITHVTMAHFRIIQVIPYCYINTVTYLLGGAWCTYCDVIGKTATAVAEDFQQALRHVGPASRVADYRSLWMTLGRLTRDVGNSFGFALTFLCLYLFFIVTLTVYGLLSQIQEGLGTKDFGLTVTAGFAVALLYFICDEAHYASTCVRVYFQKKILLVELSWMNEDAQHEVNMFLRATEMNPTDMCLGGFFDVNRNLFKSLLATMVTYLVVLLQFQISIPEDSSSPTNYNNVTLLSPNSTKR